MMRFRLGSLMTKRGNVRLVLVRADGAKTSSNVHDDTFEGFEAFTKLAVRQSQWRRDHP